MHTKLWSENLKERLLGRPRHRRKEKIRLDLRETGWAFVNTVTNLWVPQKAGNFLTS